jgi:hypothetical protein
MKCWASRVPATTTSSSERTGSSRSSITPTRIRTARPRSGSRRSIRPTRSSPTRSAARSTTASGTPRSSRPAGRGGFDFAGGFDDIIGDLFGDFFGTGRGRGGRSRARRGADLQYQLEISFVEACQGCEKTLSIPRLALRDLRRQGRQAGDDAADLPAVQRLRPDALPAGVLLDREDVRQVQRPRPDRHQPVRHV